MRLLTLTVTILGLLATAATAQVSDNPFAPRIIVNDAIVSNFEVEQRILFLRAVNSGGDVEREALTELVNDRLRVQAAERNGIKLTEEGLQEGLTEFASRANLTSEQFIAELAQLGVEAETFRDFVRAGALWREVIRARFLPTVVVTDGDIDRALAVTTRRGGIRVRLAELVLPAPEGQEADALAQAEELRASLSGEAEFSEAARQFSASPSAEQGGDIDWLALENLPPQIRALVLQLRPGEVSVPVPLPNAVALFQLRGLEDTGLPATQSVAVDYMQVVLPAGAGAEVARLKAGADRCDDLWKLAQNLPPEQVVRTEQAAGTVPSDIALRLATLDPGETTVLARSSGSQVFLMLCSRDIVPEGEPPSRDAIRGQLLNQRLAAIAEGYLSELRAAAIIREP